MRVARRSGAGPLWDEPVTTSVLDARPLDDTHWTTQPLASHHPPPHQADLASPPRLAPISCLSLLSLQVQVWLVPVTFAPPGRSYPLLFFAPSLHQLISSWCPLDIKCKNLKNDKWKSLSNSYNRPSVCSDCLFVCLCIHSFIYFGV